MKYNRFEELPVWNAAIELAVGVFALTARPTFKTYASLRNQLERAAVSVSNNVAEGFERGTTPELLTFIYIYHAGQPAKHDRCCVCLNGYPEFLISNLKFQI